MKKITAFIVVAVFICLAFTACGDSDNNNGSPGTDDGPDANAAFDDPGEIPADMIRDSLPADLDFGGATLNLHIRGDSHIDTNVLEFGVESEIGEIINDILYNRDKAVEDRLNLKLNVITGSGWQDYNNDISTIRASIAAGDESYDLIAGWSARIPGLSIEGYLTNLLELPHLALTEPWWNRIVVDEMTINNQLHFALGDGNLSFLANCIVMFVNNKIQQELGLPDLYSVVLDGGWTMDYMSNLVRDIYRDLNGSGRRDEHDLYGIYLYEGNRVDAFLQSSNIRMTKIDESGIPYLDMEYEKISAIVSKVHDLLFSNPGSFVSANFWSYDIDMFKRDQVLIAPNMLIVANQNLRDMESDYSIIPYPKFDDAQQQYFTRIQDGVSLFCVPVNSTKGEMVGAFMEAVASESYRNVSSQYFDVAMKLKYTRDEASSQMLDIIRDGAYLNFASIYNESIGNPWHVLRNLMDTRSSNFASWFERNERVIVSGIDRLVERMDMMG
jgi:hypothetical protein